MDGPAGSFTDSDLPGHQGRIVFAALALERRVLARDQLADMVWDDDPPTQWSGALTAVVSKIRALINGIGLDGGEVMQSGSGTYALALPADTWVDWEDAIRRLNKRITQASPEARAALCARPDLARQVKALRASLNDLL